MPEHPLIEKMAQAINLAREGDVLGYDMARAALNVVAEWEPSHMMEAAFHTESVWVGADGFPDSYRAMMSALKREAGLS